MDEITATMLAGYRDRLVLLQQQTAVRMEAITDVDVLPIAEHLADSHDRATQAVHKAMALSQLEQLQCRYQMICLALRRMALGEYGWCARCGS